jgi:hypothetical protein
MHPRSANEAKKTMTIEYEHPKVGDRQACIRGMLGSSGWDLLRVLDRPLVCVEVKVRAVDPMLTWSFSRRRWLEWL